MVNIEPIYNVAPTKVLTCPGCAKAPVWNISHGTFECPVCMFGRHMSLWSTSRWNRAVEDQEAATRTARRKRKRMPD